MALTVQGQVFSWGYGEDGQLGHEDTDDCATPMAIQKLISVPVDQIACGHSHSAAI
jgi:alpha-tubulin suppressor-like RCC1 family protein